MSGPFLGDEGILAGGEQVRWWRGVLRSVQGTGTRTGRGGAASVLVGSALLVTLRESGQISKSFKGHGSWCSPCQRMETPKCHRDEEGVHGIPFLRRQ